MPTEFDLLPENAEELGLESDPIPSVTRIDTLVDGRAVSALRWGTASPRVVFLHGGGQNAHTWDSVLLALGVSALAIDLPGHGHSEWREDGDYRPHLNARAVGPVIRELAPDAELVVGMSLGGLTTISVTAQYPGLVKRVILVDVSPESPKRAEQLNDKERGTVALVGGPDTFDDLDELINLTAAAAPNRPRSSIRRGVIHNTRQTDDGRWRWRYDRFRKPIEPEPLWKDLAAGDTPISLIRGGLSQFVADDDVDTLRRHRPGMEVFTVDGAGHSVQSDAPRELARIVASALR